MLEVISTGFSGSTNSAILLFKDLTALLISSTVAAPLLKTFSSAAKSATPTDSAFSSKVLRENFKAYAL